MSSYHEEEALGKAYDGRLMRRLVRFVAPFDHAEPAWFYLPALLQRVHIVNL